jgi:broad specificity phosphatase PhoE
VSEYLRFCIFWLRLANYEKVTVDFGANIYCNHGILASMKLIVIRHGQTDRNVDRYLVGKGETSINATGEAQAQAVAERLASEQIDIIYSSTMLRAKQTAEKIRAVHPNVPYKETPDIRERDSGMTKGWTIAQREEAEAASGLSPRDWSPEGG